jgi:hypothetical protein
MLHFTGCPTVVEIRLVSKAVCCATSLFSLMNRWVSRKRA